MTFNPTKPGKPQPVEFNRNVNLDILYDIACPSTSQCTAVGKFSVGTGPEEGDEVTFNPIEPGMPRLVAIGLKGPDAGVNFVACPSKSQCTALDEEGGGEMTFNPTNPGTPKLVKIDDAENLDGLACPSKSQCTATSNTGRAVTFNPLHPGTPDVGDISPRSGSSNLACPSTSQCTAVGTGSGVGETTFNPAKPGTPNVVETKGGGQTGLDGIACPSSSQCTAVGSGEATFNPTNPGTPKRITIDHTGPFDPHEPGSALVGVACPSRSQCTAVDVVGNEVTFNPTKPGTPKVVAIDRYGEGAPATIPYS